MSELVSKITTGVSNAIDVVSGAVTSDATIPAPHMTPDKQLTDSQTVVDSYIEKLYPEVGDNNFAVKISNKKEFADTPYDGTIRDDPKTAGNEYCGRGFEMSPYQHFVKNFMSFQTPYNTLLLYHGLGTGKTCSAIGVCEDMRQYLSVIGSTRRIMVIASPNVQENFKLQLFNPVKLTQVGGVWEITGCTGTNLVKLANPVSSIPISKERLVRRINGIIKRSYLFMGYIEFANYITKKTSVGDGVVMNDVDMEKIAKRKLNALFSDRLVVIDEIHNIRSNTGDSKFISSKLEQLVTHVKTMRLLVLSATPVYNNPTEIVWLCNLLNRNNPSTMLAESDVFYTNGVLRDGTTLDDRSDTNGNESSESGGDVISRRLSGLISYVRGDHPYTFPYRIWPSQMAISGSESDDDGDGDGSTTPLPPNSSLGDKSIRNIPYPKIQMDGSPLNSGITIVDVFTTVVSGYQKHVYDTIVGRLSSTNLDTGGKGISSETDHGDEPEIEGRPDDTGGKFGYTVIQRPIESLNMTFPHESLMDDQGTPNQFLSQNPEMIPTLVGKAGLRRTFDYTHTLTPTPFKGNFKYKPDIETKFGRFMQRDTLGQYSQKMKSICDTICNSEGIIMIYSQYIDGGLVPMALALEEMGFRRYGKHGSTSLFDKSCVPASTDYRLIGNDPGDSTTGHDKHIPAQYVMITGDKSLSFTNNDDIAAVNQSMNSDGSVVKVVLISQAGSEGIDFKNIRQIHVIDPWYNMSRIEQIIGRAVRNCSHVQLDFTKRNVGIFLHGSMIDGSDTESADMYLYRLAERKAIQIGEITRIMKEAAVDCLINNSQNNYSAANMNQRTNQCLASGEIVEIDIGDKPYTAACDYQNTCEIVCARSDIGAPPIDIGSDTSTYTESYVMSNTGRIRTRIMELMRDEYVYESKEIVSRINSKYGFPESQVYATLSYMVEDDNEVVYDMLGRPGLLRNIDTLYFFQPLELKDNLNISMYDRTTPANVKQNIVVRIPEIDNDAEFTEDMMEDTDDIIRTKLFKPYDILFDPGSDYNVARDKHLAAMVPTDVDAAVKASKAYLRNMDNHGVKDLYPNLKYIKSVFDSMAVWGFDLSSEERRRYVVDHLVDYLSSDDMVSVITHYINNPVSDDTPTGGAAMRIGRRAELDTCVWNKLRKIRVSDGNGLVGFVIPDVKSSSGYKLLIQYSTGDENRGGYSHELRDAERSETIALAESINRSLVLTPSGGGSNVFGPIVGFIVPLGSSPDMVFRTKNMSESAQKGSTCDAITHGSMVKRLNLLSEVIGFRFRTLALKSIAQNKESDQTNSKIKQYHMNVKRAFIADRTYQQAYDEMDKKTPIIIEKTDGNNNETDVVDNIYGKPHLCIMMEMLLRYHDDIRSENKRWFLSPTIAEINMEMIG